MHADAHIPVRKKPGLHPPPFWRPHVSDACAALRLYKPSCSHPSSHSITPTHTRAVSKEKGKRRRSRTGPPAILVSCTCTPFRLTLFLFLSLTPHPNPRVLSLVLFFSFTHTQVTSPRAIEETQCRSAASPPRHPRQNSRPVFLGRSLTHAFTHGASMKITYAVMPIGGPVRSIDGGGASTARRAVKTTLKNLKRWCARLRHGTATCGFKDNRQNHPGGNKIIYDGNITMMMIVDQEESRNRANENLENELRESLANNDQSETHDVFGDDDDCGYQPGDQWLDRGWWSTCPQRSEVEIIAGVLLHRRNENLKVALVALKIA